MHVQEAAAETPNANCKHIYYVQAHVSPHTLLSIFVDTIKRSHRNGIVILILSNWFALDKN